MILTSANGQRQEGALLNRGCSSCGKLYREALGSLPSVEFMPFRVMNRFHSAATRDGRPTRKAVGDLLTINLRLRLIGNPGEGEVIAMRNPLQTFAFQLPAHGLAQDVPMTAGCGIDELAVFVA